MPMRQECKHFESRTYPNGETVRKCDLDLAPDAPWRCPAQLQQSSNNGWTPAGPTARWWRRCPRTEPPGLDDGSAAALLDEAEDFLNSIGEQVLAEVRYEQARRTGHPAGGRKRFFRRRNSLVVAAVSFPIDPDD